MNETELLREIGLVGYLLLVLVAAGVTVTSWMVKRLVDALVTSHEATTAAIQEIVKHEATERELLERMSDSLQQIGHTIVATHEIARQWQVEGTRKTDK